MATVQEDTGIQTARLSRLSVRIHQLAGIAAFTAIVTAAFAFGLHYQFNWGFREDFVFVDWYRDFLVNHQMSLWTLLSSQNPPHPIGSEALLSVGIFSLTGFSFTVLVIANFTLVALESLVLVLICVGEWKTRFAYILSFVTIPVLAFQPTQTNHLLWPFELGWFMITFLLIMNICLLECLRARGLLLVTLSCLVATFCSAHGVFLWVVAAAHCLLLRDVGRRFIWAAFLVAAFVVAVALVSDASDASVTWRQAVDIIKYFTDLYGSLFGTRNTYLLLPLGVTLLSMLALCCLALVRYPLGRIERTGLMLVLASFIFVAAFSLGRFKYGLPWVLDRFHAAPLLMPFGLGLALLSLRAVDRPIGPRAIALLPCVFLLASTITSAPYALQRARESQISRALAMRLSCTPGTDERLLIAANALQANVDMMRRDLPTIRPLCATAVPKEVDALLKFPEPYADMIVANPQAAKPLHALWDTYITHDDLMRAFPIADAQSTARLLAWARGNAQSGSEYDNGLLRDYESFFKHAN